MAPVSTSSFPEFFNIAEHFLTLPAHEHPDKTAILGAGRPFSYSELAELASRVSSALLGDGVAFGDRVLIVLPDSAEFMAAFFGAAKIGAIAVPVNSMARSKDYEHYLMDCGARIAIVAADAWAEFSLVTGASSELSIILVGAAAGIADGTTRRGSQKVSVRGWQDWIAAASSTMECSRTKPTDSAFFLYTSGSGGAPKAAVHQHKDMLVTSRGFAHGVLGLRAEDITFSVSKLFFAYGLGNGMYFPFSVGATTVVNPETTKVDRVIALVEKYRPTAFFAVPTFYGALLRESENGMPFDCSSIRLAVSAGEKLPAAIFEKFRQRFGLEILDGIGSTEMLHMFLSSRPGKALPGSCGIPVPGYEAKIVDDTGREVPGTEIGNLWVRGESAFAEYWGKRELTERTKREENWVVTGDKFTRDSDGYHHYCGRTDDMLKVAGMWVSPMEVENVLLGHGRVAEAAVVGITDASGLTYEVAYVVLADGLSGSDALAQELREYARARLVPYKCPREVRFCAELPKTATGKIQRFKLRDLAAT